MDAQATKRLIATITDEFHMEKGYSLDEAQILSDLANDDIARAMGHQNLDEYLNKMSPKERREIADDTIEWRNRGFEF